MQPISFYHQHLEAVSRSFSFCILQLQSPAKEWVALSYLLCRVIDTIEDSNFDDKKLQCYAFDELISFLSKPPSEKDIELWLSYFPDTLLAVEKNLLVDLPMLLADINQLPTVIQNQLQKTLKEMIKGMVYFLNNYQNNHKLILPTLATTNQYCFFVAGIVGELLSCVFNYTIPAFTLTEKRLNQSFHFGLFLQKINILKDQRHDELAGRCYIASQSVLRGSIVVDAQQSMHYLKAIPVVSGRDYRLFCAWSLFIGLASLKWIDRNTQSNCSNKIGRRETRYLVNQVRQMIDDNDALETLFRQYLPHGDETASYDDDNHHKRSLPIWFRGIYESHFPNINIGALGIGE